MAEEPAPLAPELQRFAAHLEAEKRASIHTRRAYLADLAQYAAFLAERGEPIVPSSPVLVRAFVASAAATAGAASLGRKLSTLRSFYRFLVREGLAPGNPARAVSSPRLPKRLPQVLPEEEVAALVEAPPAQAGPLALRDRDLPAHQVARGRGFYTLAFGKADGTLRGEKGLRYFIGSGATARSYLLADAGYLFEAPAAYYPGARKWSFAPAYDRYAYPYLSRPAMPACLTCHASFLTLVAGTQNKYDTPPFAEGGIACVRCHPEGCIYLARNAELGSQPRPRHARGCFAHPNWRAIHPRRRRRDKRSVAWPRPRPCHASRGGRPRPARLLGERRTRRC
jgi:hypothetical protein